VKIPAGNNVSVGQSQSGSATTRAAVSVELVGRDVELAALRNALDAATTGRGAVAFLVGNAGIGKSRLAQVLASEARQRGMPALHGRASQTATPAAYRPIAEALSSALRSGAAPDGSELGAFRAILGRLVPEWRGDDQKLLDEGQVAVAEAALLFLRATARDHGALLILEDLHWADPETLTIVEYLTDNVVSERILCVVTVRDDDSSSARDLVRSVLARRISPVLQLSPLDQQQVVAMVASCLGSSAVPDEVVAFAGRADGVPFMVEELLAAALASDALVLDEGSWQVVKSLEAVIPPTLVDTMRQRVGDLDEHCQRVLVAAAVLGRRFDWSLLPGIVGLDDEEVLGALHDAVGAQIILFDRDEGSFRFRHALSRDAVLSGLFPPELEALSRRALEAVQAAHPELDEGWGELAAELAAAAGDRRRAAALLLESLVAPSAREHCQAPRRSSTAQAIWYPMPSPRVWR
jgi:predicted ATPase